MKQVWFFVLSIPLQLGIFALSSCLGQGQNVSTTKSTIKMNPINADKPTNMEIATFANGCFWCTEAIFEELKGVASAVSGYTGGAN